MTGKECKKFQDRLNTLGLLVQKKGRDLSLRDTDDTLAGLDYAREELGVAIQDLEKHRILAASRKVCARCGRVDRDFRDIYLTPGCTPYNLDIPFDIAKLGGTEFYTIKVCLGCCGDFLRAIKNWFHAPKEER